MPWDTFPPTCEFFELKKEEVVLKNEQ